MRRPWIVIQIGRYYEDRTELAIKREKRGLPAVKTHQAPARPTAASLLQIVWSVKLRRVKLDESHATYQQAVYEYGVRSVVYEDSKR